jgi:hypothetical protein
MLENLKPEKAQPKCKVGRFLDTLDSTDEKLMLGYLADADFSAEAMSNALKGRGIADMGPGAIRFHRTNNCACRKLG